MSEIDDIGTVRWFGPSWGAPACVPAAHIEVPVGVACAGHHCERRFVEGDQGVTVPHIGVDPDGQVMDPAKVGVHGYHLECWLRELGIGTAAEVDAEA